MTVYIVFNNDELTIPGVFDSEVKAVKFIEDAMTEDGTKIELDVLPKEEFKDGQWEQQYLRGTEYAYVIFAYNIE